MSDENRTATDTVDMSTEAVAKAAEPVLWEHLSVSAGGWFTYDRLTGQYRYTTTEAESATDAD